MRNDDLAATMRMRIDGGPLLAGQVRIADRWFSRLRGLMFTDALPEDTCLLIIPCQQVHTHFMRYALDVVFLDRRFQVLRIIPDLAPWRLSPWVREAHAVVELNAGMAARIEPGQRLVLEAADQQGLKRR